MRVPGLDSPVQLSSQEVVREETKLIESFKDLPSYKPLRLVDMNPQDPNYAAEVTRQILHQGKDGTLATFVNDPNRKKQPRDPKTGLEYRNYEDDNQLEMVKMLHQVWYNQQMKNVQQRNEFEKVRPEGLRSDHKLTFLQTELNAGAKKFFEKTDREI